MLCLNFPGSSPSSFPHSRHPGCLLFTKPGPPPAQGLAFILEKSSGYASGISLFLVPFNSQHRDHPWPPHLEASMLFYIYFLLLHFIFVSSSDQHLTYVCLWSASLLTGLGASWAESSLHLPPSLSTAAAAAAKSLQSCPTLCDPIDGSPPGSPVPGILQARVLEWVAIFLSNA